MPVAMEMTLLLLLFGGLWTQEVNSGSLGTTTTLQMSASRNSSISLVSDDSEAPNLNSVTFNLTITRDPEKGDSTRHHISPPSSTPYMPNEVSTPGTFIAASSGLPVPEPTTSQEVSTKKSSVLLEIPNTTSNPAVLVMNSLELHMTDRTTVTSFLETSSMTNALPVTMTTSSLETSSVTSGPPVTTVTSSLETSKGTSGFPVTMATSSLETSKGTSGLPVTMATSSLETSKGTSGLPVTMATSSLETSKGTSGLSVTMTTSSLEASKEANGFPIAVATSSLETSKGTSSSPISTVKISTMTISETTIITRRRPDQGTNGTLLVAVLTALVVVIVLLALLVLWCRRQKRRTGTMMLSRGGKRNGVVDAWAGPVQVNDEEAMMATAGASGGDKGSGVPEGEGSGRRPTLTTFFDRKKSHQGSLALEELKAGSASGLKGEEEPLVSSEDGAVETPASDGPEARDGEAH